MEKEIEYGYDISGMKAFSDAEMTMKIPIVSLSKEQLTEILGGIPIVRCRDCKHYKEGELLGPTKFCFFYQIGTGLNTADDDFCSKGERRV